MTQFYNSPAEAVIDLGVGHLLEDLRTGFASAAIHNATALESISGVPSADIVRMARDIVLITTPTVRLPHDRLD